MQNYILYIFTKKICKITYYITLLKKYAPQATYTIYNFTKKNMYPRLHILYITLLKKICTPGYIYYI